MPQDMQAHWAAVAEDLNRIRERVAASLTGSESLLIGDFIDNNELGLAFEHICDALARSTSPLPVDVYELLAITGARMELDPVLWERLTSANC